MAWASHGQVTVSGTAAALTASTATVETLLVKGHPDNTDAIYVGASGVTTSTGYAVAPGEEFIVAPAHGNLRKTPAPKDVYVCGTSNDKVTWIGTSK